MKSKYTNLFCIDKENRRHLHEYYGATEGNFLKIGWNYTACSGGIRMAGNPIFIFGTGEGLNIGDFITWDADDTCDPFKQHHPMALIRVKDHIDLHGYDNIEITIGPYHKVTWVDVFDPIDIRISNDSDRLVNTHIYCVGVGGKVSDHYEYIDPGNSSTFTMYGCAK